MENRILILAPRGRDSQVIAQVFSEGGIGYEVCPDLGQVRSCMEPGAGALLVTEEALAGADLTPLLDWIERQPPWSDIPVIVLATKQSGCRAPRATQVLGRLGNVVLLERPINAETLTSAARSALRARGRQYQARALLLDQERAARELRLLNESLEQRVEERTRELDAAHEALSFALRSAGMGSWDLDLATDTSRRSLQHDRIFGYDSLLPSWGREAFLNHVLEEDRLLAAEAFARAAREGDLDLTVRIRRPDGAVRWIETKGRVEYAPDGQPVRMAGIVTDTTDSRHTEDALRQAQKMEAIGQLTGGVAHDFNNLLTVIIGGLDMMLRRPEQTDRVVRLAGAALTAARRGEQLIQQLLAFSRRQMVRPETLNPNRLLLDFESLAGRAAGEAVDLALDLDPAVDPIRIDPALFQSAVLNLIVNARDAMPEGGAITIRSRNVHRRTEEVAEQGMAPGPYVAVSVTDSGSGMDPETLVHVFEPFFTTKDVGKGSGLGLAQVYGFTRSAGGDVAISTEVGVGTTVSLFFPRSADAAVEAREPAAGSGPLRRAAAGETVLLVEDDEDVLAMAVESLEELQYRVMVARNAREALDHVTGPERIDIMFSDVIMPGGMNGAQLAVEARRLRPELKVLLTSGYVGESGAGHLAGGNVPVLNKPYQRDELAQKLRVLLGAA
ncbi:MAG: ATP-binding protein [Pseudomonadota bacterium]|nr:ATP-binding protein [Pseudomonadota bacterium]